MNKFIYISILSTLVACSDNPDNETPTPKNDHIWKTQTDALKKAEDLAEQLNEQFKKKAKQIEQARE